MREPKVIMRAQILNEGANVIMRSPKVIMRAPKVINEGTESHK